jgi:hypothetical protein
MSDEVPETADGAIRAYLIAIGFTLVLIGGEMMAEKNDPRTITGLILIILALPVHLSWVFWKKPKPLFGVRLLAEASAVATSLRWWLGVLFILLAAAIFSPFIEQQRWPSHFLSDFSPNNERTFDYSTNDGKITVSAGGHAFVLRFSKGDNTSIYLYKDGTNLVRIARVKSSQQTDYDTSSRVYAIKLGEAFLAENTEGAILAGRIIDLKDDSRGDDHDEVRFTYELSRDRK